MNLSKKTFLYSAIISGTIVTLMIAYFVLMLPSLYVDYIKKLNFKSIKSVQTNYLRDGNYTNISSRNLSGTATIKVPMEGNSIFASNMFGSIKINIDDEELFKKYCGNSVIIIQNDTIEDNLTKKSTRIEAPENLIAISCESKENELEIINLLASNNINFKRSNNDIEIMVMNAKASPNKLNHYKKL